jgi:saccharopine dehydrogenase (NADP+, L-glutamate forming)
MAKKVLVLGAGLVSRPLVVYLLKHGIQVTVATRTVSKARAVLGKHRLGKAVAWTTEDADGLRKLAAGADLVVSLLPPAFHPMVAGVCLELGKHLLTTSYVSDAMKALDGPARDKGLVFMNEAGLDPGIDHMSAMRIIHHIERKGGKVQSFRSMTGALPSHGSNTNPFGYKFSWAPRGVLLASRNRPSGSRTAPRSTSPASSSSRTTGSRTSRAWGRSRTTPTATRSSTRRSTA